MAFFKTGQLPADIGRESGDLSNIMQSLNDVCMEEWGVPFSEAVAVRGIKFPPTWKDGDQDWEKDERGNLLVNQKCNPNSVGKWLLNVKNTDPVGCADHLGNDTNPKSIYGGSYCRAKLDISAYTMDDGVSIISIKLIAVQKCYEGTPIGNVRIAESGSTAFSGRTVQDGNSQPTDFSGNAPAAPSAPSGPAAQPTYTMTAAANGFTREEYLGLGWTDEALVQHGFMTITQPTAPSAPSAPTAPTAPTAPSAPAQPGVPSAPSAPAQPGVPSAPSAPAQPGVPSAPSAPAQPGVPSAPSAPSAPGQAYLQPPVLPGMPQ